MRTRVELYEEACRLSGQNGPCRGMGVERIMVALQQADERWEQITARVIGTGAPKEMTGLRGIIDADDTVILHLADSDVVWVDTSAHAAHRALAYRYDGSPLRLHDIDGT